MAEKSFIERVRRKFGIYPKFWLKSFLYRWTPGGWGFYRELAKLKDESYDHERDKHPVRHKHTGESGWKEEDESSGEFVYRDYGSYEEYLDHQKVKFDEMLKAGAGFGPKEVGDMRIRFYRRFRWLPYHLEKDASCVCAGARQGTEVEVLQDLGFKNAYGTDLNPGPENPWVREGDFMKMDEADESVDFVFCNAIDHVHDIDTFFSEQTRILKKDGFGMYEVMAGTKGGAFEAIEWESDGALIRKLLQYFRGVVKIDTEAHWMWFLLTDPIKSDSPEEASES